MKVTTDACLFGSLLPTSFESGREKNILDIGTGTGLLALMYAQKNPEAIIDAIEIDEDAAAQAKENVEASPWKERINVIHADTKIFPFTKKYDLVISNPPFYEKELKAGSSKKNFAHHGEGLLIKELLPCIKKDLKYSGIFCLLLPYKRNEEIKKLLLKNEFEILKIIFIKQSVQHDYFRIMLTGKRKTDEPVKTEVDEISVWDEKQEYTNVFRELLGDYYLYL
jgi:tRNA1Val (adenine37-N6)-methyltransferase